MKRTHLLVFFGFFAFFIFSKQSQAAILNVSKNSDQIYLGDEIKLDLTLNTENESVNAGEIYLNLPNSLEIKEINSNDSIFKLWVNEPNFEKNLVSFIGGIPFPGFTGTNGHIGSIIVKVKNVSDSNSTLNQNSKILLNDGLGTETKLSLNFPEINIENPPKGYNPKKYTKEPDTTPPANLQITIGRGDTEFEGNWFVSFTAEDKDSGIAKYEIAEIPENQKEPTEQDWQTSKSPYILKNQNKNEKIYVKAIDNAGNFSIKSIEYKASMNKFRLAFKLAVIILVIALLILLIRKKLLAYSKKFPKK